MQQKVKFSFMVRDLLRDEISEDTPQIDDSFTEEEYASDSSRSSPALSNSSMDEDSKMSNEEDRPKYSYNSLIVMAIQSSKEKKLALNEIYEYIMEKFPYYKNSSSNWRNSIRHNLSLNNCFIKVPRMYGEVGKGSYWMINPSVAENVTVRDSTGKLTRSRTENRYRKASFLGKSYSVPYSQMYPYNTPVNTPVSSMIQQQFVDYYYNNFMQYVR